MSIVLVAALATNRCIGKNGGLPWHIPEDFEHFKMLTQKKVVLMGRKTWESIPKKFRPLPDRINVVITRQKGYAVPNTVEVFSDIQEALTAHQGEEICIIGGGDIYRQTIPLADRLSLTEIDTPIDGDTFFPSFSMHDWEATDIEEKKGYRFVTYVRKKI